MRIRPCVQIRKQGPSEQPLVGQGLGAVVRLLRRVGIKTPVPYAAFILLSALFAGGCEAPDVQNPAEPSPEISVEPETDCEDGATYEGLCQTVSWADGVVIGRVQDVALYCDYVDEEGTIADKESCPGISECGALVTLEDIDCLPGRECGSSLFVFGRDTLNAHIYGIDPTSGTLYSGSRHPLLIEPGARIAFAFSDFMELRTAVPGLLVRLTADDLVSDVHAPVEVCTGRHPIEVGDDFLEVASELGTCNFTGFPSGNTTFALLGACF